MKTFQEYCRLREIQQILNEGDPYYNKDFIRFYTRNNPEQNSFERVQKIIDIYFQKVNFHLKQKLGKGLDIFPTSIWQKINSKIRNFLGLFKSKSQNIPQGFDQIRQYPKIYIRNLALKKDDLKAMDLEAAYAIVSRIKASPVDKNFLAIAMLNFNSDLRQNIVSPTIDFWAYYNGLSSYYETPSINHALDVKQMMQSRNQTKDQEITRDTGQGDEQSPIPTDEPTINNQDDTTDQQIASWLHDLDTDIVSAAEKIPYEGPENLENIIANAIMLAHQEISDEILHGLASIDKRKKSNLERIQNQFGFSWSDFKSRLQDANLRRRWNRARGRRKRKLEYDRQRTLEPNQSQ